ncbi:ATP-binding protein [Streptomyces microflavus]|uniref:ATP-binding protein n=1 Tax=Streptomyces microflavus TaxID=1919 RepID=UPI00365D99CD
MTLPNVPPVSVAMRDLSGMSWQAPALARKFTRERLTSWGLDHAVNDARTIVSELTTNAVRHGGDGPLTVSLTAHALLPVLLLSVTDRGRPGGPLRALHPDEDAETGRGLAMVEALAALWSWTHTARTTTVWAVLPLSPLPADTRTS